MTEHVLNLAKPYNTKCTGLAFDNTYKQIIVTTEVQSSIDEGIILEISADFLSPFTSNPNSNVVVSAYTLDRKHVIFSK